MNYLEKKRLLLSYRRIVVQERALNDELTALSGGFLKGVRLDGMPRGGSAADLANVIIRQEELLNELGAVIDRKHKALRLIMAGIEKLPDENEKAILTLAYIKGMTLIEVADEMCVTYRHLRRLHKRAVEHFEPEDEE